MGHGGTLWTRGGTCGLGGSLWTWGEPVDSGGLWTRWDFGLGELCGMRETVWTRGDPVDSRGACGLGDPVDSGGPCRLGDWGAGAECPPGMALPVDSSGLCLALSSPCPGNHGGPAARARAGAAASGEGRSCGPRSALPASLCRPLSSGSQKCMSRPGCSTRSGGPRDKGRRCTQRLPGGPLPPGARYANPAPAGTPPAYGWMAASLAGTWPLGTWPLGTQRVPAHPEEGWPQSVRF